MSSRTNAERLNYIYFNLVGQVVQVHTTDGAITEGIFVSCTDDSSGEDSVESGIILSSRRRLASAVHDALDSTDFSEGPLLFRYEDIIMIEASNAHVRMDNRVAGQVQRLGTQRGDLQRMDWGSPGLGKGELLEDEGAGRFQEWDQFADNERKFGLRSTYDEGLYTTKLPENISEQDHQRAEMLAREIEGGAVKHSAQLIERHEILSADTDEATAFSDVIRRPAAAAAGGGTNGANSHNAAQANASGAANAPHHGNTAAAAGNKNGNNNNNAGAGAAGGNAGNKRGGGAAPGGGGASDPTDFIRAIADAISLQPSKFAITEDGWPGEERLEVAPNVPMPPAPGMPMPGPGPMQQAAMQPPMNYGAPVGQQGYASVPGVAQGYGPPQQPWRGGGGGGRMNGGGFGGGRGGGRGGGGQPMPPQNYNAQPMGNSDMLSGVDYGGGGGSHYSSGGGYGGNDYGGGGPRQPPLPPQQQPMYNSGYPPPQAQSPLPAGGGGGGGGGGRAGGPRSMKEVQQPTPAAALPSMQQQQQPSSANASPNPHLEGAAERRIERVPRRGRGGPGDTKKK